MKQQYFQDHIVKNAYQGLTFVVFRDKKSIKLIPDGGQKFSIPAPVIEDRPGGLGLADIEHLLDSKDRDEFFEFPSASNEIKNSKERIIVAQIWRSCKLFIVPLIFSFQREEKNSYIIDNEFYTLPPPSMIRPADRSLATYFLSWGGFHKLEPVEKPVVDIKETVWHKQPQMRMRAALQRCSRLSGFANPAIISKRTAHRKNDGEVSNSSPGSASMDSPGSSSPTTRDIPISHESTSKPTQSSRSLPTEFPQPPSQSPPEQTLPPPKPPGQLTPEQPKKASQRQMSKAKEPMVDKQRAARKAKEEPEEKGQMPLVPDKSPEEPLQARSSIVAKLWKLFGR